MVAPISVVLLAKNEGHRIARCLESLQWISEIVVVDGFSTDNTVAEAARFSNVRVVQSEWKGYGETKLIGLSHATHNWIFWMDADEVVTPELRDEIEQLFAVGEPTAQAFDMPRCTNVVGTWIRHGGWYPDTVLRLFHKKYATFNTHVLHEGVDLFSGAKLAHLKSEILHYSYDTLNQFFQKMVHYGPLGAQQALRAGKRFHLWDIALRPFWTFFRMYILKMGFRDGTVGFIVCLGSGFSTFIRYSHLYELNRKVAQP